MRGGPLPPTTEAMIRRCGAPVLEKPFTLNEVREVLAGVMRR
jgi:hypothetical protein